MGGCCAKAPVTDSEGSAIIYKKREHRGCTDLLFCVLFLVFWVGMLVVLMLAVQDGDPNRLLYASDYKGRTCGTSETDTAKAWIYYPRIIEDILLSGETNPLAIQLYGVCMSGCPTVGDVVCDDDGATAIDAMVATDGIADRSAAFAYTLSTSKYLQAVAAGHDIGTVKSGCWLVPLDTADYFYRCVWVRNKLTSSNSTCLSPPSLYGLDLDASTTTQEQRQACITKTMINTEETEGEAQENPLLSQMFDTAGLVGRYVSDAGKASAVIWACGLGVSVFMGFVFLIAAQKFSTCMVWTTIYLVTIGLVLFTIYAYSAAGLLTNSTLTAVTDSFNGAAGTNVTAPTTELPAALQQASATDQTGVWSIVAYVFTAITLIVIALIIAWRKRIKIATAVISEAARAVKRMPMMLGLPIITTVAASILLVYFLLIASFISSSGSISAGAAVATANAAVADVSGQNLLCPTNETTGEIDTSLCANATGVTSFYSSNSINDYLLAYHFFGFLWTNQFIQAIAVCTIAGAIGQWYFDKTKDMSSDEIETSGMESTMGRFPVVDALKVTLRFHLGSIAFGSMLIAIVQFIRAALEYLNSKTQKLQQKNIVLKAVFCCVRCCLWCFEKCIKFLTNYAFVVIAIKGDSFCKACKDVIQMIVSNPVQIGVVNMISGIIFMLGKLAITVFCAFVAFQWMDSSAAFAAGGDKQLESYSFPLLIIMIFSFTVASLFMNVFGLAVDTILICFLYDRNMNNGADKPYYMSDKLLKAIGQATHHNRKQMGVDEEDSSDDEGAPEKPSGGAAATTDSGELP